VGILPDSDQASKRNTNQAGRLALVGKGQAATAFAAGLAAFFAGAFFTSGLAAALTTFAVALAGFATALVAFAAGFAATLVAFTAGFAADFTAFTAGLATALVAFAAGFALL
jgi:hypothetical protein